MKHRFNAVLVIVSALFFSCGTNMHLSVPGEESVTRESVGIEYLAIADSYADLGKYDKAVTYYLLAMKNKKLYWSAYYKLGRAYALAKDWSDAENVYDKLLQRDPANVNLKLSRAYIKAMSGNLDEAMMLYRTLLEEQPENDAVLVNYITILLSQGRAELAEEQLEVLKKNFPDNKSISNLSKKIGDALKDDGSAPPPAEEETKTDKS
jgi:tetratricopeptide (TPR) repeat protein